jgi:hypothetical protein
LKIKTLIKIFLALVTVFACDDPVYSPYFTTNLISYWKMDETSGLVLEDSQGRHYANCTAELGHAEGMVGNARFFNFANLDRAIVPNDAAFNFPANSSFSIVYWLKFTDTQYGLHGGQDHIVISKGDWNSGGPNGALWGSGVNGSGKVNFLLSDDTGYKIDLEGPEHYNDGLWHQVACIRDGSAKSSRLYVDAIVVDQATHNYTGSFTNTNPIAMAHLMNYSNPEFYYMGYVDEIAIYSRALSSKEITFQYEFYSQSDR